LVGSRFQTITTNPDVQTVLLCRKKSASNVGTNNFGDVAIIQTNTTTGATCFFQALNSSMPNIVSKPSTGTFPWKSPAGVAQDQCHHCHDNGPLIRSPYLTQVGLPGTGNTSIHKDEPYFFLGSDFSSWRTFRVKVEGNTCTQSCHYLGMSNLSGGTARSFGPKATATGEAGKLAHSPTSPIWMPMGATFYSSAEEQNALAIKNCADSAASAIAGMGTLPNTVACSVQERGIGKTWVSLGGDATTTPVIVGSNTNRFDVFARGSNGETYWNLVTNGVGGGWISLGGTTNSAPTAVRRGNIDDLDVFVRATNDTLYRRERRNGQWGSWISMGGVVLDAPHAASTGNGVVVAFRSTGNSLGAIRHDGFFWLLPENLGGGIAGSPTVVSWGGGRADIYVRGSAGGIHTIAFTGSTWSGFASLGGDTGSNIAAVAPATGRVELAVRGTDNKIYRQSYDVAAGGWGGWISLEGRTAAEPAVAYHNGTFTFFAVGSDYRMHRNRVTSGVSSGWGSLGTQEFWFGPAAATIDSSGSKPVVVGDRSWANPLMFIIDP
jgi:hypothetical protein